MKAGISITQSDACVTNFVLEFLQKAFFLHNKGVARLVVVIDSEY